MLRKLSVRKALKRTLSVSELVKPRIPNLIALFGKFLLVGQKGIATSSICSDAGQVNIQITAFCTAQLLNT